MTHPILNDTLRALLPLYFCLTPLIGSTAEVFVEAESFQKRGGWKLDTQFIQQMGSPYLLAHGLGRPVDDAITTINVAEEGNYRLWVRTKDWVARWNSKASPGKFQVIIDGKPVKETFGTKGAQWGWHNGGVIALKEGTNELRLKDLTGFDGRCDCIY
ncbi:MAG: FAD-dependent oxidoreductase, partial [Rubripirellula sp.]